jgi:hypothetical protein
LAVSAARRSAFALQDWLRQRLKVEAAELRESNSRSSLSD